ncbi:MAG: polymer-forming cytoskeletal protein [Rhodospirillaceae bacterium]|nr:polymer-forming cytoskeletal protein [Rhodospirillaceae bacterium]MBT5675881.1 polymer-forming cytoskeletal protein [Rhodospirillaceae bacterium]MBT6830619.1 polymer-forming cytoskeletal protein [Rhodospirillaceae bacterium]
MFFTSDKKATAPQATTPGTQTSRGLAAEGIQINRVAPQPANPLSEESRGQKAVEGVMRARGQFRNTHLTRFSESGEARGIPSEAGAITVGDGVRIEGSIVSFRTLEVLGFLKGELAGENLTVASGKVAGTLSYRSIEIDNGGIVQGSLDICPIGEPDQIGDHGETIFRQDAPDDAPPDASDDREIINLGELPNGGGETNNA